MEPNIVGYFPDREKFP